MARVMMDHRERIEACMANEQVDRPAVALWRHFPVDDQDPLSLAEAAIELQRRYDFDLVKISPSSSFCIKDWGSQDEWNGAVEGTRDYTKRVIQVPDDWEKLAPLDPNQGYLAAQLECMRLIVAELSAEVPVIQTVFNPLSQAKNLIGADDLSVHLRKYPEQLKAGLKTIAVSIQRFLEAGLETGVDGIFYAVQHAQYGLFSEQEYESFGTAFDRLALQPIDKYAINMLHLHGRQVMFDHFLDYPFGIINWHDRESPPSLKEARGKFSGALCGGLRRQETMVLGTPVQVKLEARDAIQQTGGRGLILGTGCVMPTIVPRANIVAARQSVEV
ncbi:MAG: uroporphyrinogen decarboxylase family protein [Anaerolineales bacterium]